MHVVYGNSNSLWKCSSQFHSFHAFWWTREYKLIYYFNRILNMKIINSTIIFSHCNSSFQSFLFSFSAKTWALWDKAQRKQLLKWRLTLAEQVNSFSTNLWRKCKMRCIGFFWALHNAYNKFTFLCRNFLFFWGAYNSKQHNTTLPYKMRLINKIIIAMCPLCRGLAQGWNSTSKLHSLAMLLGKKGISRLP